MLLLSFFIVARLVDIFLKDRANICFLTTFGVLSGELILI